MPFEYMVHCLDENGIVELNNLSQQGWEDRGFTMLETEDDYAQLLLRRQITGEQDAALQSTLADDEIPF